MDYFLQKSKKPLSQAQRAKLPLSQAQRTKLPLSQAQKAKLPLSQAQKAKLPLSQAQKPKKSFFQSQKEKLPFSQKKPPKRETLIRPLNKLSQQKKNIKTTQNMNKSKRRTLPLTDTYEDITTRNDICDSIKSKNIPVDSSLKVQFVFGNILLDDKTSCVISLKTTDSKNFVLLSSNIDRMYLMLLFICKYKIKPGFIRYSISNSLNPFTESKSSKKYYYMIFKSDKLFSLQDAIVQKQINLYDFKKGFIRFLKSYIQLNKKYDFIYNNINSKCLYVNFINGTKDIIMFDYTYSYDSTIKKTTKKTYDKSFYDMKELYDLKDISEKIEGNYDLLCIIFLINICNSYLNEIPKELVLNKEDKDFFNAKHKLYEKLNVILKKDFLKTL